MATKSPVPSAPTNSASKKLRFDNSLQLALIVGGVIIAGGIIWLFANNQSTPLETKDQGVYYTGPRFNRNTGKWVDGDGRIVPPPEGESVATPTPKDTGR